MIFNPLIYNRYTLALAASSNWPLSLSNSLTNSITRGRLFSCIIGTTNTVSRQLSKTQQLMQEAIKTQLGVKLL